MNSTLKESTQVGKQAEPGKEMVERDEGVCVQRCHACLALFQENA